MDPDQTVEKIILSVRREIYFVSKRAGDKFEISLKNLRDPTRPVRDSINVPQPDSESDETQEIAEHLVSGQITVSADFRYAFDASSSDFFGSYYPESFYVEQGDDDDDNEREESEEENEEEENKGRQDENDDGSTVFESEENEDGVPITDIQLIHKACKVKFFSKPFVTCWVRCGLQDKDDDEPQEDDDCLMYCKNSELFIPFEVDYMLGKKVPVVLQDIDDYTLFNGMPAVYSKTENTITVFSMHTNEVESRTTLPPGTRQVIFLNEPWKIVVQTEENTASLVRIVTEKQRRMLSTCLALSMHPCKMDFPREVLQCIWEFLI